MLGPIPACCEQATVSPLPVFESPCREIVGHEMGTCVSPHGTGPVATRTQQWGLAFPHIRPWSWPSHWDCSGNELYLGLVPQLAPGPTFISQPLI